MIWSEQQNKAIFERGKNILVNAGAGSGKTAVLTERVLTYVKSSALNSINDLVVLTFTKTAASEMKERIKKNIGVAAKDEASEELKAHLLEEEKLVDASHIETFDAFSLSLVKKYHYILGIDKSVSIMDDNILSIEKNKLVDEYLNELYERKDARLFSFLDHYTIKNDDVVKEVILKFLKDIENIADKKYFFEHYEEIFFNSEKEKKIAEHLMYHISLRHDNILAFFKKIQDTSVGDDLKDKKEEILEESILFERCETYEDLRHFVNNHNIKKPRRTKSLEVVDGFEVICELVDEINEEIEELKNYLRFDSVEDCIKCIRTTKNDCLFIVDSLKVLVERLNAFKKKEGSYTFNDIALLAINLFKNNEDVLKDYKKNIKEILVDEYQDTSDIQEELVSLIGDNNVYMVGDVKQSIYRFRNANPQIFKDKSKDYGKGIKGLRVDLVSNYRSRQGVLRDINIMFESLMGEAIGGVDYDDTQKLVYGNKAYLPIENEEKIQNTEFIFYEDNITEKKEVDEKEKSEETKKDEKENEKRMMEALCMAEDIKNKVQNGFLVADAKKEALRPCNYGDFAILLSTKKEYDTYQKVFEYMNIPVKLYRDEPFKEGDEISVIRSAIDCVYSLVNLEFYQERFVGSLLGLMRSFVYQISDDIIHKIVVSDNILSSLEKEAKTVYEALTSLKEYAFYPVSMLMEKVYEVLDIHNKSILIGDVDKVCKKLDHLLNLTGDLAKSGKGLKDLVEYLDHVINFGEITYSGTISDSSSVSIMTIHKSKGLQFKICYFAELDRLFNERENTDPFIYSKDYGFILPSFKDNLLRKTILKTFLKDDYHLEEVSEELRLFYVALTRAEEKMIFILPKIAIDNPYQKVPDRVKLGFKSFLDFLKTVIGFFDANRYIYIYRSFSELIKIDVVKRSITKKVPGNIELKGISLSKELVKTRRISKVVKNVLTKDEAKAISLGTEFHEAFEMIDFLNLDKGINISSRIIKKKIDAFLSSDVIKGIKIINYYPEYYFTYNDGEAKKTGFMDLVLEAKDEMIIIDYKLSDVNKEEYVSQVNSYKSFLETQTNKKIKAYLYSIYKEEFKEVV